MYWYETDVIKVESQKRELPYQPATLFYGSSTFRLWETLYDDFKTYFPLNMGFGGSTLEACVHFFPRLMKNLQPDHIYLYAGDNDLGDGKTPENVLRYFHLINDQIGNQFANISYTFISIKPSICRWHINDDIIRTNNLVEDAIKKMNSGARYLDIYPSMLNKEGLPNKQLFEEDGLHLNEAGYKLWKAIVSNHISSQFNTQTARS